MFFYDSSCSFLFFLENYADLKKKIINYGRLILSCELFYKLFLALLKRGENLSYSNRLIFTFSNSIIEIPDQCVKFVQS